MLELELENWQKVIDTNLTSAFLVSRAAAKRMIARDRGGKIINVGSLTSRAAGQPLHLIPLPRAALRC